MVRFVWKNRFHISIAIIILYLLFTLIAQVEKPRADIWFSTFAQSVAYPFQLTFLFISAHSTEAWNHYVWLMDVREKNRELTKKLHEYRAEIAKTREIQIAYDRVLRFLRFQNANADQKTFAQVIGEVKNGFSRLVILDKGSEDGIKKNFAVVSYDGIVGKIQSVTPLQSIVQLITDTHSRFPVLLQRTRAKGFLQGEDGILRIEHVRKGASLKPGDKVIASGLAGIFPKGFPVGSIDTVDRKKFGLFQSATVKLSVDLDKLEEVAVILQTVNNIHQPLFTESNR